MKRKRQNSKEKGNFITLFQHLRNNCLDKANKIIFSRMQHLKYENHLISGLSPESFDFSEKIFGQGTFGRVFEAFYGNNFSKKYAIKCITIKRSKKMEENEFALNQFKSELQILETINKVSPKPSSILPFYGHFIKETIFKDYYYCFVFDFLEKSLSRHIFERNNNGHRFHISELRRFYTQILHGMAFLQSIGVSHRDLKPGNLMLDDQGNLKIIDFGISVNILELLKVQPEEDSSTTGSKVEINIRGTRGYFSPEILAHGNNNPMKLNSYKSDVFSFGLILLEAATFRKIDHQDDPAIQSKSVQRNLRIFYSSSDSYSTSKDSKDFKFMIDKLERCLEFDPERRPDFIELFKEDLKIERIPQHIWVEEQASALSQSTEFSNEIVRLKEENRALKYENTMLIKELTAINKKSAELNAECRKLNTLLTANNKKNVELIAECEKLNIIITIFQNKEEEEKKSYFRKNFLFNYQKGSTRIGR